MTVTKTTIDSISTLITLITVAKITMILINKDSSSNKDSKRENNVNNNMTVIATMTVKIKVRKTTAIQTVCKLAVMIMRQQYKTAIYEYIPTWNASIQSNTNVILYIYVV